MQQKWANAKGHRTWRHLLICCWTRIPWYVFDIQKILQVYFWEKKMSLYWKNSSATVKQVKIIILFLSLSSNHLNYKRKILKWSFCHFSIRTKNKNILHWIGIFLFWEDIRRNKNFNLTVRLLFWGVEHDQLFVFKLKMNFYILDSKRSEISILFFNIVRVYWF